MGVEVGVEVDCMHQHRVIDRGRQMVWSEWAMVVVSVSVMAGSSKGVEGESEEPVLLVAAWVEWLHLVEWSSNPMCPERSCWYSPILQNV